MWFRRAENDKLAIRMQTNELKSALDHLSTEKVGLLPFSLSASNLLEHHITVNLTPHLHLLPWDLGEKAV